MILRWPTKDSIMLGVAIQDSGKTAVVHSLGRIVVGETEALRKAVLAQNRRTVVLDLTGVDAIDGSGIGLLVFLQGWARAAGVDLQLVNPTRSVRELLELTNLDSVFKILSSEDAVSSHAPAVPSADETAAYQCAWR
jgi:anti-sigma B factor antagonist